jgi:hypothetical protein
MTLASLTRSRLEAIMDHRRRQRVEAARKERVAHEQVSVSLMIAGVLVTLGPTQSEPAEFIRAFRVRGHLS